MQATFTEHLEGVLGWDSIYAWNQEILGPDGTLGRADTKEAVLTRDLRAALERLNPDLPASAIDNALRLLTVYDVSRSMVQHNLDFYRLIRGGVRVEYRDTQGRLQSARARVIDFANAQGSNRFLAVRELKLTGIRTPNYNRRADLVCFVNGLPLVFIELKAVYKNIREGFDNNLSDYMGENVIAHAFHHNAFLIVSNGDRARYGSITSKWEHFAEWKRLDEADKGSLDAEVLLNGMLAHDRLLDMVENFILVRREQAGRYAQGDRPQPPGFGRQPGRRVGGASGRAEVGVPSGAAPQTPRRQTATRTARSSRKLADSKDYRRLPRPSFPKDRSISWSGRIPTSAGSACSGTRRAAASLIPWRSLPRRCGGSWKATSLSC